MMDIYKLPLEEELERIDNDAVPPEKRTFSGVLRAGSTMRE